MPEFIVHYLAFLRLRPGVKARLRPIRVIAQRSVFSGPDAVSLRTQRTAAQR
jgi:hypothetical protein